MYEILKSVIFAGGYKLADIQHKIKKLYAIGDLTEEEKQEQAILRREYIDSFKQSLVGQLENTYVLRPDGSKEKLTDTIKKKD